MSSEPVDRPLYVDVQDEPEGFPTHWHPPAFWEALGRAVSTFGFLEDILGRAIFTLSAARQVPEENIEQELEGFLKTLRKNLTDALGGLIKRYDAVIRADPAANDAIPSDLLDGLYKVLKYRNALCHGSWGPPNDHGQCVPRFFRSVDGEVQRFETPIDVQFLIDLQKHTAELTCGVINSVTQRGLKFPGANGHV